MRVTNELELPIRHVVVSGPAVEALETRKERSSNPSIEAAELRKSFNNLKDGLFAGAKELARTVSTKIMLRQQRRSDV